MLLRSLDLVLKQPTPFHVFRPAPPQPTIPQLAWCITGSPAVFGQVSLAVVEKRMTMDQAGGSDPVLPVSTATSDHIKPRGKKTWLIPYYSGLLVSIA